MKNQMRKVPFNLTTRQDQWLRQESKRLGIPMGEVLRRILDSRACGRAPNERTETQLIGYLFEATLRGKNLYDGCASITDMIGRLESAQEELAALITEGVALSGACEDDCARLLCDDAAVARKHGMVVVEAEA